MKFRITRSSHYGPGIWDPTDEEHEGVESPTRGAVFDREASDRLWEQVWVLDVNPALLLGLVAREGNIILSQPDDSGYPTIEIYDGYRE